MKKALIVIDYVNDFVADNGNLTCGEPAQKIEDSICNLIEEFNANKNFVVIASDSHKENDSFNPEHKLFPAHCIAGTPGNALYGKASEAAKNVTPELIIEVDKIRYSAFAATNLDLKLRERKVTDIYLVGVCTDICVLHTAVDAYNLGYNIFVYENAVATFNPEGHKFALAHFKNTLGATIL